MNEECIVVTRFARDQPGFLDFSYRIKALAGHYKLTVVSHYPLDRAELKIEEVEYIVLASGESRFAWLHYLYKCAALIRERRPACAVLLHSLAAPVALFTGRIPLALYWNEHPTRITASANGSLIKRQFWKFMQNLLFLIPARRSLTMPIGEAHMEDLLQHGCDPHRVKLIYMGVDSSFDGICLHRKRLMDEPLKLVYTGSVQKDRGRDIMLEAIALANKDQQLAHLTIVGATGPELAYCQDYARRLGIEDCVNIYGRVPGSEIPSFLIGADAGICIWDDKPWWRFNPPTKLFEYLVAGLPVLASNIRTHTQYISQWDNGVIFEYEKDSLAQTIRELAARKNELPMLSQRAYESGRQYLWEKIEPIFLDTISALEQG